MKVLLLGRGGTVHALAWKIVPSPHLQELYCAPGNAATDLMVGPLPAPLEQQAAVVQWAFSEQLGPIVVHRMPAWVDRLGEMGLPILGADGASWEALRSRGAVRAFLRRRGIPTLEGRSFQDIEEAERYLVSRPLPLWIRPDDCLRWEAARVEERYAGLRALDELFHLEPDFGVSIESDRAGREVGLGLLTDGCRAIPFGLSRPYDRRCEGGRGPLTEGMGAYAPARGQGLTARLMARIGRPVVEGLAQEGLLRPSFLYLRIVLSREGPVLRDLRWGLDDLHAAVTLPLWGEDLLGVLEWAAQGHLEESFSSWWPGVAVAVAMVVEGYPDTYPAQIPLPDFYEVDARIFHHDTRLVRSGSSGVPSWSSWLPLARPDSAPASTPRVVTAGGRVLFVVGYAPTGAEARELAYKAVGQLGFQFGVWRADIAAELG